MHYRDKQCTVCTHTESLVLTLVYTRPVQTTHLVH